MKKILQLASAAVVTAAIGIAPAVSAASSCDINLTGNGSVNKCIVTNDKDVTITCNNNVTVSNVTTQNATSGSVVTSGNTISGTATSGDAANVSALATDLTVGCGKTASTTPTTTTPPTTPSATPTAPAAGAGVVRGASTTQVAALPNTGPSTLVTGIAVSTASVGVLAALVHFALSSYRRRAFKA